MINKRGIFIVLVFLVIFLISFCVAAEDISQYKVGKKSIILTWWLND